jgi:hypothetical protein
MWILFHGYNLIDEVFVTCLMGHVLSSSDLYTILFCLPTITLFSIVPLYGLEHELHYIFHLYTRISLFMHLHDFLFCVGTSILVCCCFPHTIVVHNVCHQHFCVMFQQRDLASPYRILAKPRLKKSLDLIKPGCWSFVSVCVCVLQTVANLWSHVCIEVFRQLARLAERFQNYYINDGNGNLFSAKRWLLVPKTN